MTEEVVVTIRTGGKENSFRLNRGLLVFNYYILNIFG